MNQAWRLQPSTPADSAVSASATIEAIIAPEQRRAFVSIGVHCGLNCGSGWSYLLVSDGKTWRLALAMLAWIV